VSQALQNQVAGHVALVPPVGQPDLSSQMHDITPDFRDVKYTFLLKEIVGICLNIALKFSCWWLFVSENVAINF
jgi:hypothetical protein